MTSRIRFAQLSDAAALRSIYAPFCEASAVSFESVAPTVEQMAERIARVSVQYPWLVCEFDGRIVGYVYGCAHRERAAYRWSVDVTIYVDANCHRQGIGRALYTSLLAMLREQGYFKAFAGVTLPNPGSIGLHETMGFKPVAVYRGVGFKMGQWRDVGWWQLELQPELTNPAEPTPIDQIRDSQAIAAALAAGECMVAG